LKILVSRLCGCTDGQKNTYFPDFILAPVLLNLLTSMYQRMKGIRLLFAVMLAPLVFHAATADDAAEIARAATRRGATNTVSSTRKKTSATDTTNTGGGASRTISTTTTRTVSTPSSSRSANVVSRTATTTETRGVGVRGTGAVLPRTVQPVSSGTITRSAVSAPRASDIISRTKSRTTERSTTTGITRSRSATVSRAATTDTPVSPETVLTRDFGKCRDTFYECMDEFCANKDTELGRCACSTRISEFDRSKHHLSDIEDKLLTFGERLLTVNMDAEDVTAMNQATAGENAFNEEDKSASKKMLDEIAKKLNTSFDDSAFDNGLNAINLSLNMDAAFDNVDSLMGASTTTKSGTALYQAALPVCREMAAEVCSPDEQSIAESGYQMMIEQACNTVAKTYQTQTNQAHAKLMESSALLEISRLDIHQQRNSDDILTCRKKMLDMLTDSTVCGDNLGKCLDISGRYIDPTTGAAFLTTDLAQLSTLITRPTGGYTWAKLPQNSQFVSFLNSKKIFLEPAMENCQDLSSYVWDSFLDDALAQIKLAQDAKLEEMRQSCTTLTTQCLDTATDSIQDFDSRALSIFGVSADRTVNAMCSEIKTACSALIQATDTTITDGTTNDWESGMTAIAQDKTYETILSTCREVGCNCIINTCKSATGNFDLCTSITRSVNRKSILNRSACWNEVVECVAAAGADTVNAILNARNRTPSTTSGSIYGELYGSQYNQYDIATAGTAEGQTTPTSLYDLCKADECGVGTNIDCGVCRLAEQIWGNCEANSNSLIKDEHDDHNKILTKSGSTDATLLSWFAHNTSTTGNPLSCYDAATCPPGQQLMNGVCTSKDNITTDGIDCKQDRQVEITTGITNCCDTGKTDDGGNCCTNGASEQIAKPTTYYFAKAEISNEALPTICVPAANTKATLIEYNQDTNTYTVCVGNDAVTYPAETDESNLTITCNGTLIQVQTKVQDDNISLKYIKPTNSSDSDDFSTIPELYYTNVDQQKCTYYDTSDTEAVCETIENINKIMVDYQPVTSAENTPSESGGE